MHHAVLSKETLLPNYCHVKKRSKSMQQNLWRYYRGMPGSSYYFYGFCNVYSMGHLFKMCKLLCFLVSFKMFTSVSNFVFLS